MTDWPRPDLTHLRADLYQQRVRYAEDQKAILRRARDQHDLSIAEGFADELGNIQHADPGILVDLFLTYRDLEAWAQMVGLVGQMRPTVANTLLVQEQLGFALNRLEQHSEAERVLKTVIAQYGPRAETCGLLGRVYKDQWRKDRAAGKALLAEAQLDQAIEAYLSGFQADIRDCFPGINAASLMDIKDDPHRHDIIPVVRYAAQQRIAGRDADYWDHATLMEIAVLSNLRDAAVTSLKAALPLALHPWMTKTTSQQLTDITEARAGRGEDAAWITELAKNLEPLD